MMIDPLHAACRFAVGCGEKMVGGSRCPPPQTDLRWTILPYSVTFLNHTPTFHSSGPEKMLKRDWTRCSKHDTCSNLESRYKYNLNSVTSRSARDNQSARDIKEVCSSVNTDA
jgi:hypothetical protein